MPTSSTNALFDLGGKTALVTGAGGYLGAAIAYALAEGGAKVLLNGRNAETLETVREQIITNGGAAELAQFDITSDSQVKAFVADRAGKPLHVLVNNAYAGTAGDIKTTSADDFATALDVGLTAAFRLVQALQPQMAAAAKSDGDASVINIASMYGSVSPDPRVYGEIPPNPPQYGAVKGGLIQLTRYLAVNLATDAIRVNAISPGPFPPPSVAEKSSEFIDQLAHRTPLGRIGRPDDIKAAVLFLAGPGAGYVTGTNLAVDGGWTAW